MDEQELKACRWVSVPGLEHYEVSSDGRVRCWVAGGGSRRSKPREKAIQTDKDGYPFVLLYRDGLRRGARISRLMLEAFRPDGKRPGYEASHLNGDRSDNRIENLAWESRLENERRKTQHGTRPAHEDHGTAKLSNASVLEIRRRRAGGEKLLALAQEFGVTMSQVCSIAKGRSWASL